MSCLACLQIELSTLGLVNYSWSVQAPIHLTHLLENQILKNDIFSFSVMAACANFNVLDHLQCSLCLDIYDDPKCLTCLHSFCKTCIDETLQFNHDGSARIVCPECKEVTLIGLHQTTHDLRANFQIRGIVDAYDTANKM